MSILEKQVRQARRRLWLNRWLRIWGWCLFGSGCIWTALLLVDRLLGIDFPLEWLALGGACISLVVSVVWLACTQDPELAAAIELDRAAGLRERVSTCLEVPSADDPFAAAVHADAERSVAGLSARRLIPVQWSGSLSYGSAMLIVAALLLLLPEFDLLKKKEAQAGLQSQIAAASRMREVVAQPVSALSQLAEKQGDEELNKQIKELENALKPDVQKDPDVLRRETVKQLDKLQDALKNKANEDRFKALDETKKRLRQMAAPEDAKGEAAKLIESMAAGDFQEAQKELKKLQENLAKRSRDGKLDPKQAEEMRKQLNELAQKLEKAAQDKQSQREMENMGMSKQDIQRVLDALAKKDPQQLEKLAKELAERMKDQGVSKEQLEKMIEKLAQRQEACKSLKEMGEKMANAGKQLEQSNTESAQEELSEAGEQLSEMEQLEQQLNEMEAQMSMLDEARDQLGDGEGEGEGQNEGKCSHCQGKGFRKDGAPCPNCNGTGDGMGGQGRGSGKRDRAETSDVDFKNQKVKGKNTKSGRVISQQYVKGEHLKGKSQVEFQDAATAAEIDATDALNRERIPRPYRKGVRNYFDRLGESFKSSDGPSTKKTEGAAEPSTEEKGGEQGKQ
ncbi:MAG: hypothetical protein DCC65_14855 [Planctomycetota bacterium]|nr:MAG: hypothetical protein DCC65_14855 [Planctomycetota bacterium]